MPGGNAKVAARMAYTGRRCPIRKHCTLDIVAYGSSPSKNRKIRWRDISSRVQTSYSI